MSEIAPKTPAEAEIAAKTAKALRATEAAESEQTIETALEAATELEDASKALRIEAERVIEEVEEGDTSFLPIDHG